jgi:hypothetical protein
MSKHTNHESNLDVPYNYYSHFHGNIKRRSGVNIVGGDLDPEQAQPVKAQNDERAAP